MMTKEAHFFYIVPPRGELYQREDMQEHRRLVLIRENEMPRWRP
jgi:hypothetical protein